MRLQIANDEGTITEYEFDSDIITVGRTANNTIQLNERNISRSHLRLVREEGSCFVEDAGSSFGLRLNGTLLVERTRILPGDRVELGDFMLRIAADPGEITAEIELGEGGDSVETIAGGVQGHLIVTTGPDSGVAFPLDRLSMMLGSAEHNPITVRGVGIAEVHAEITWKEDEGFSIEELNGDVIVNNLLVESARLTPEDVIDLGEVSFSLRLPPEIVSSMVTTAPANEWDPQAAATIQGDSSMIPGATGNNRKWLVPLLGLMVGLVAASWWAVMEEEPLTQLQADVTGQEINREEVLPPQETVPDASVAREAVVPMPPVVTAESLRVDAKSAMIDRRWDDAITLFQSILEREPEDQDSKVKLAQCEVEERRKEFVQELKDLQSRKAYVQAWESIRSGVTEIPEESVYYPVYLKYQREIEEQTLQQLLSVGEEAMKREEFKMALRLAKDALSIEPKNKEVRELYARAERKVTALYKAKRKKRAPKPVKEPENQVWKSLYDEGRLAKRSGNNDLAITKFKSSLAEKNTARGNKMLGILYAVQGNSNKAVKYYKEYLRLNPEAKDAETVRTVIEKLGGSL